MFTIFQVTLDISSAAKEQELTGSLGTIGELISSVLGGVMVLGALLLLMYLLWGGLEWISAGGDSGKIQKARDKITQGVIGLIVLASSVAIFNLVQQFVGVDALRIEGGSGGATAPSTQGGVSGQRGFGGPNGTSVW